MLDSCYCFGGRERDLNLFNDFESNIESSSGKIIPRDSGDK